MIPEFPRVGEGMRGNEGYKTHASRDRLPISEGKSGLGSTKFETQKTKGTV